MPTYDYKCLDCGITFELFQKMSDSPLDTCQQCGGKVRRLIGAGAGIIFKGSGFYCTDYRAKPAGDATAGETAAVTPASPEKK